MLDGVEITSEEKVKAENLHGYDVQDREIIFKSMLPEEKFIDRRIATIEDVHVESDSDGYEDAIAGGAPGASSGQVDALEQMSANQS